MHIVTGLVSTAAFNTNVKETENKIPDIISLSTKTALKTKATDIENRIPNTSIFITALDFKRLTKISFNTRFKEADKSLVMKTEVKNGLDLGDKSRGKIGGKCFLGKSYFEDDETLNYLVFQPVLIILKRLQVATEL